MALIQKHDPHHRAMGYEEPGDCFLCGDPLPDAGDIVYWAGFPNADVEAGSLFVYLHPACAERLGANLIGDAKHSDRLKIERARKVGMRRLSPCFPGRSGRTER